MNMKKQIIIALLLMAAGSPAPRLHAQAQAPAPEAAEAEARAAQDTLPSPSPSPAAPAAPATAPVPAPEPQVPATPAPPATAPAPEVKVPAASVSPAPTPAALAVIQPDEPVPPAPGSNRDLEQARKVRDESVAKAKRLREDSTVKRKKLAELRALEDAGAISSDAVAEAEAAVLAAEDSARVISDMFDPNRRDRNRLGTVVINTTQTNTETVGALYEDLSVMSRLLDKSAFGGVRQGQDQMMGIMISGFQGSHSSENLYIEGQGAILIRNVKFALLPYNVKENDEAAAKKDSAWDEAKSELYGPRETRVKHLSENHGDFPPYDPERVEKLKREIVSSLKYAANIRGLGAGESVTVVLLGSQEQSGFFKGYAADDARSNKRGRESGGGGSGGQKATVRVSRTATMTIRVKKSDAEAALKGSIDLAELQKRAAISIY